MVSKYSKFQNYLQNKEMKKIKAGLLSPILYYTRFFLISNLGFCLELGLLNSETEIGTGVV